MTVYRCAAAWLGDGTVSGPVDIACTDGIITAITDTVDGADGADGTVEVLPGLVLPGFADAHSHVFHRALRGRTHGGGPGGPGTFWTWRDEMYALAARLDPDGFHELAVATYAELVCAGYTAVGEFHYLHHAPGGVPYADANVMGAAVLDAGDQAGIAVALLDVVYLAGGFGEPVNQVQQRFSDGTADAWAARVAGLPAGRVGAAIHSVRAVPPSALPVVAGIAAERGWVLHAHVSEQPAENEACLAATGSTPVGLLADAGALDQRFAAVHATHLTAADVAALGAAGASVVICPTTEADLADGLPAAGDLAAAGAVLTLGGDQHVVVDPFAQARGLEYGERLATGRRGTFPPAALLHAATAASHAAIGSPGGRIAVGAPADLVAVRTDSTRTAGARPDQLVMAASAADVAVVVVAGRVQARQGVHVRLGDPGRLLERAIRRAWEGVDL